MGQQVLNDVIEIIDEDHRVGNQMSLLQTGLKRSQTLKAQKKNSPAQEPNNDKLT